ncbi:MAG: Hpt domain-containing protein [Polyangiaceae bacterium]|nr:Hpt domain-containing protein [Myxococcales bacterium]MCB9587705.1 Hpt domain-containing protein [Polyangiaceae bacterium]
MSTEAVERTRSKILDTLLLPKEVTDFERSYLGRVNKIGLVFFALHLPVFVAIAYFNDTGPWTALVLTLAALAGPTLAYVGFDNPRSVSLVYGFTSMIMGGLLVHFGQGPVQIEMHFYFFALLAMLAVYGNPMVIVVAAVTVALHHLLLWAYLPRSVFNYDAPIWVVAVHAAFVVLESIATVSIARSFFDNVIGLEKIVQARTTELDKRNAAMRLVLDNVDQGFLTVCRDGTLSPEYSSIVKRWLGTPPAGGKLSDFLASCDPDFALRFELGWDEVVDGIMPLELTLEQLPRRLDLAGRNLHFDYSAICDDQGEFARSLVVITDITAQLERERLEVERRETMHIFDRIVRDKSGFLEFFNEADGLVESISEKRPDDLSVLKRQIHTLKGNAMLFGIHTIGDLCHELENRMDEGEELPPVEQFAQLSARWDQVKDSMDALLGERSDGRIEVDDQEFEEVLRSLVRGAPRTTVARKIAAWKLEPTQKRLCRVAEQARGIARRLGKGEIKVDIDHSDLRLDAEKWAGFWSSFVHVVRNAVDHGLEAAAEDGSKVPTISLTTRVNDEEFAIEIADNGRGIDWRAVAAKAQATGLPSATQDDLVEALFRDGISTRSEASLFSGRGVGMGAMRNECLSRGGRIEVHAEPGKGTSVRFSFPKQTMAEDPIRQYQAAA